MTDKLREAAQQALEQVQEFNRRWCLVPAFGNKVNKATREAVTNAHSPIFQMESTLRAALAEQPAEQESAMNTDRQMIEDLLSALEYHQEQTRPIHFTTTAIQAAREHLRAAPVEPEMKQRTGNCLLTGVCASEGHRIQKAEQLAEQEQEQDHAAYNGWVLREVLFDNGEPIGHRAQEPEVIKAAWLAGYTEGEKAAWAESDALLRQLFDALVLADCRLEGTCLPIKEVDDAIAAGRERLGEQK